MSWKNLVMRWRTVVKATDRAVGPDYASEVRRPCGRSAVRKFVSVRPLMSVSCHYAYQTDGGRFDRISEEHGERVRYLHQILDTVEFTEIIRDLRLGEFDVLVGLTCCAKGWICRKSRWWRLDADKEASAPERP